MICSMKHTAIAANCVIVNAINKCEKGKLIYFRKKQEAIITEIGARGRTRTGTEFPPRDFKSLVSTNSTTRAWIWKEGFMDQLTRRKQLMSKFYSDAGL